MANCSSTPLVDLIARCELYAKVIEGIFVVDDEWQPGEAGRQEPRETLLSVAKILHSIRAQGTISPEYAAELGRQVDELEAENATLRAQCAGEPVAWR